MKKEIQKDIIAERVIPEAQQNLVVERFEKTRNNPERMLDWDEAKKSWKTETQVSDKD